VERAAVSRRPATSALDRALLVVTDERVARERSAPTIAWSRATAMQRTWADCYGYALVATGRAEVALDPIMNVWDCAALLPIVEEAGGRFTDWRAAARSAAASPSRPTACCTTPSCGRSAEDAR
jgi:fructose-1,6-bisphosphatase/inositol monophosphatase family enzyme